MRDVGEMSGVGGRRRRTDKARGAQAAGGDGEGGSARHGAEAGAEHGERGPGGGHDGERMSAGG